MDVNADRDYGRTATAEVAASKPLTLEITNRLDDNISTASEVRSRLYGLRDRLFGASPTAGSDPTPRTKDFACFDDATRSRGRELGAVLADIDSLSNEIANRL